MPAAPTVKATPRKRRNQEYSQIEEQKHANDPKGFVKHPQAYGYLLSGGKLGGALQRDLIYWIEFHTFGQERRPEWAKLSLTALAKLCQVWENGKLRPVERKSVATALADLAKRGIIEVRDRKGCSPTVAKMYKVTPERWKSAPPYIPPTKEEIEAQETEDDEAQDDAVETTRPAEAPAAATVQPGKSCRPPAISLTVKECPTPINIQVEYHSDFDQPLSFRARPGTNGRLRISVCRPVEQKANGYGCPQPQLKKSNAENKRFSAFDSVANDISLKVWGIALEDELIRRIAAAAQNAPPEIFARICHAKFRDKASAAKHQPGLLVNLAGQAARSYAKQQAIDAARAAATPSATPPTPEELAELERRLKEDK